MHTPPSPVGSSDSPSLRTSPAADRSGRRGDTRMHGGGSTHGRSTGVACDTPRVDQEHDDDVERRSGTSGYEEIGQDYDEALDGNVVPSSPSRPSATSNSWWFASLRHPLAFVALVAATPTALRTVAGISLSAPPTIVNVITTTTTTTFSSTASAACSSSASVSSSPPFPNQGPLLYRMIDGAVVRLGLPSLDIARATFRHRMTPSSDTRGCNNTTTTTTSTTREVIPGSELRGALPLPLLVALFSTLAIVVARRVVRPSLPSAAASDGMDTTAAPHAGETRHAHETNADDQVESPRLESALDYDAAAATRSATLRPSRVPLLRNPR